MSIMMDTSVICAYLSRRDSRHADATEIVRAASTGEWGRVLTTTFILDEAYTLLRARGAPRDLALRLGLLAWGSDRPRQARFFDIENVGVDDVREAAARMGKEWERGLSLTDWTTVLVAERARVDAVATFDAGLRGLVDVVPDE